jgi:hypothetical protein
VVKCLPNTHEALGLIPSTNNNKMKRSGLDLLLKKKKRLGSGESPRKGLPLHCLTVTCVP